MEIWPYGVARSLYADKLVAKSLTKYLAAKGIPVPEELKWYADEEVALSDSSDVKA